MIKYQVQIRPGTSLVLYFTVNTKSLIWRIVKMQAKKGWMSLQRCPLLCTEGKGASVCMARAK